MDRDLERSRVLAAAALALACGLVSRTDAAFAQERPPNDPDREVAAAPAAELRNPLPYTATVIAEGRKHYLRHCQTCHGYDGRALENIDFEATDLTRPEIWRYGTSDGDLFRTTQKGAGQDMPPFATQLEERQIWELVHYLRSIGPEKLRPKTGGADEGSGAPPP